MTNKRFSTETEIKTSFVVVNRLGLPLLMADTLKSCKTWVSNNLGFHGELEVQEVTVTTTTTKRRVYKPAPKEAQPGMPKLGYLTQPRRPEPDCDAEVAA